MKLQELVVAHQGHNYTTSIIIAAGAEITHNAAIKLIRKYQEDFEEFGLVGFEIQPNWN